MLKVVFKDLIHIYLKKTRIKTVLKYADKFVYRNTFLTLFDHHLKSMVCPRKIVFLVTNLMHVVISQSIITDHETQCKNLETVKEIRSLKQQIAKQASLINDVILMKKELKSKVQQIERNTNDISDIQKNLQYLSSKFTTSQGK